MDMHAFGQFIAENRRKRGLTLPPPGLAARPEDKMAA